MDKVFYISSLILFPIVGLCIGSFLNVVIYRLSNHMSLIKPGSHCIHCNHPLAWYDNIPLISYILLKGRCRYCQCNISPRYFIVEFLNMLFWFLIVFFFYEKGFLFLILNCLTITMLLCMAFYDIENHQIPLSMQIILLLIVLGTIFYKDDITSHNRLLGMFTGGAIYLFFYGLSFLIFKREGLGLGDVILMFSSGFILGFKRTILAIIIISFFSLIYVIVDKIVHKKEHFRELPFAPFIALGVIISIFLGNQIIEMYLNLFF